MVSRSVSIADLKNNLSAHLARVRAGEELLIRDRRTPIAKIVPLTATQDQSADELALAAEGLVRLPDSQPSASFWRARGPRVTSDRALEILHEQREDR
jgi:prevent-host-death family protein